MSKVAVIGCGVVGSAVAAGLQRLGHSIFRHDLKLGTSIEDVIGFKPDVTFICVPTPSKEDGSCDTKIVEDVVEELAQKNVSGIIAIKSTVTPGTTQALMKKFELSTLYFERLCFVPEFLRERSAFYDFTEGHDTLVIGAHKVRTIKIIRELHGHYPKTVVAVSPTEAELVKYYSNVFNAMRITFANGFYDICKKLGADYTAIKDAVVSRGTIKDMYLDCNDNFRGFGGMCLPKDTKAINKLAQDLGLSCKIFDTILKDNDLYDTTVFDGMRE